MGKLLLPLLLNCVGVTLTLNSWDLPKTNLLSFVNVELNQKWMRFKKSYNKTYVDTNEEVRRRLYWEDTLNFIQEHNLKNDRGESSYTVGENDFADMAEDEFEKIYLRGLIIPEKEKDYLETLIEPDPEVPLAVDWRRQGLVSKVKNQKECAASWAFSVAGALEGQWKKMYGGPLKDLSEQNLVDCATDRDELRGGCDSGWIDKAYKYIKGNGGIDSESCYPYVAKQQRCNYRVSCKAASVRAVRNIANSEHSLQRELAQVGPISIAIDANHRSFWYYRNGIYYEPRCRGRYPNIAMLAVGYGVTRGREYWTIKNSWGTSWGEQGYIFIAKNKGDTCGVARWASYPVV